MNPYVIQLSWNQISALVDIADGYVGSDSARYHLNTICSLQRRGLLAKLPTHDKLVALKADGGTIVATLSPKGEALLDAARWTYRELEHERAPERAKERNRKCA